MRVAVPLILVLIVLVYLVTRPSGEVDHKKTDASQGTIPVSVDADEATPDPSMVRLIKGNPFISDYGRGEGTTSDDLEIIRDVVRDCQLLFKDFDRYHLPDNREIIRFLQGSNPDRLAWIPSKHPLINSEGELLDRYGTPIFFHRLSGMTFEYRSAGPDGDLWNDDDIIVK